MNKIIKLIMLVLLFILFACDNSIESNIEVVYKEITNSELMSKIDTSTFYYKYYTDWESPFDSIKVNKMAKFFSTNYNSITEMWTPNSVSVCYWGYSNNFVFINLIKPEAALINAGYIKYDYNRNILHCWGNFREYKIK